ncbi:hypothetical protein Lal_00039738, partial [Lupinus albus]
MSDFEKGRSYWIGSYPNFSFARPVVKKPTFLRLRGSFEYEIQSWKYNIPLFLLPKVSIYFEIKKFLVDLDLRILVYSSLVEWKGLAEEGSLDNKNEWEDRKVGRIKNFLVRRMELAKHFVRTNIEPKWIVLCLLPILPHELRPIIQIAGGKLTSSYINELYRIVIYRNNTFIDLLTTSRSMLGELVMCQEKLVQEALDTLLDNGIRGQPMRDVHNKTFVICGLIRKQFASNIGIAKSKIRKKEPIVWEILQEAYKHSKPFSRERAICLHQLVCKGFNADFDGDQMDVHVPLSLEAQAEAHLLMFSHTNILSSTIGDLISRPTQDMHIGLYILTSENRRAYRQKRNNFDSPLWIRWPLDQRVISSKEAPIEVHYESLGSYHDIYEHYLKSKKLYKAFVEPIHKINSSFRNCIYITHSGSSKDFGFHHAIATSISLRIDDLLTIPSKGWLVKDAEQQGIILGKHHHYGNVHSVEKLRLSIEIWYATSDYLRHEMNPNFRRTDPFNPVHIMSFFGARGNASHVHQLVGMRGLMPDPQGQIIDLPIHFLSQGNLLRVKSTGHSLRWTR